MLSSRLKEMPQGNQTVCVETLTIYQQWGYFIQYEINDKTREIKL